MALVVPVVVAPSVTVLVGEVRVVVLPEIAPRNPVVVVTVPVAAAVPLIVPVQLVPSQQQATWPAQSYVQYPFPVQHTLAALSVEQELQFWRLASSSSMRVELSTAGASMRFGDENGAKISIVADMRARQRVNGRRMALCIVLCEFCQKLVCSSFES